MIENFLRPPRSLAEFIADGLRGIGLLSIGVAGVWFSLTDAGILAFALPALVAARFIGTHPAFESASRLSCLLRPGATSPTYIARLRGGIP